MLLWFRKRRETTADLPDHTVRHKGSYLNSDKVTDRSNSYMSDVSENGKITTDGENAPANATDVDSCDVDGVVPEHYCCHVDS